MTSEISRNRSNSPKNIHYIYELPYRERKELCCILDMNDKWKELGGIHMQFDCTTLDQISKAIYRRSSPSEELLVLWGNQNHTILELFTLLLEMHHFQAMKILKPFVDAKYYSLIYEGPDEVTQLINNAVNNNKFFINEKKNQQNENNIKDVNVNRKNKQNQNMEKENSVKATEKKLSDLSLGGTVDGCIPHINYKELELATNCWNKTNILGRGGFGVVFKGIWKNTAVAIKRLEPQKGNEIEYNVLEIQSFRELKYLNSCRHDNILPLYGYSIQEEKYCLIYQYMQNGSLEDRLQCRNNSKPLTWILRCKIATGAARGLQFLHGMEKPLVHGDIKSANILLGPHFEPKIGDFGLAREGPVAQYTHIKVSRVHGTRPYLPDEFLRGKKFSPKVDTYSFGVVLFEIATGLRAYDSERPEKFLKEYVDGYDEERIKNLIDIKAGKEDTHIFGIFIKLGKNCVLNRAKDRPEMVEILKQLEGIMTEKELLQRAIINYRENARQSNWGIPSNPLQLQMFYDQLGRKQSVMPPSSSYHPQQWLFDTPFASNQPFSNRRSPSPSNPAITNQLGPSQPFVGLQLVPEANTNEVLMENVNIDETNESNNEVLTYQNPPDIRLFPPDSINAIKPDCDKMSITNESTSSILSISEDIAQHNLSVEKHSCDKISKIKSNEKITDEEIPNITLLQN